MEKTGRRGRNPVALGLSVLSTVLLFGLVLVCIPLTVPRVFGYQIFYVVSGSMEPAIPIGSLVYVREEPPEGILPDEVIAFYGAGGSSSVITHRVVENHSIIGEFITKGDANPTQDMNPVPYGDFIGKVARSIPGLGRAAEAFTSQEGKTVAGCGILAALLMQAAAYLITQVSGKKRQ